MTSDILNIDMKTRHFITLLIIASILFVGCDNNKPSNSLDKNDGIVNWVGSEYVYGDIEGKKEYSLLYFYTDWCGYCHKMDSLTFTNNTVADLMNESFNPVRINAESDTLVTYFDSKVTCIELKDIYEIGGYPTICVFKGNGVYVTRGLGYTSASDLTSVLNAILNGEYD